ncbi:MAG: alkaline phosphatase D family protein [Magnetococcales bacterium]|nr:alkaline phosphatase D family protein [Magnetococcales bacterium]
MNPESCGRREFLQAMASLAALLAVPRSGGAEAVSWKPQRSPFGLGVASGSPTADGFVLWTRLVGGEIPANQTLRVDWEVFDPEKPATILAKGQGVAPPELGHSVHVEVTGLPADRWYGYRFRAGEMASAAGRTRTLPAPDALPERLRFSYASCQRWEDGFYAAYRHMRDESLDLVIFLGDYIYEGASSKQEHVVRRHHLSSAHTLQEYRDRYALYKSDPLLQAMHAHCPWLVTWDDHEVQNDYAGKFSMYDSKDFLLRRAAAYQAYYEHMPLRVATMQEGVAGLLRGAELRIYHRVEYGRLATFHVLDCRQYRDAPPCSGGDIKKFSTSCVPKEAPRSMLGVAQERWLEESFRQSAQRGTRWNIVAEQSRIAPGNYNSGAGHKMDIDLWDGYPEARVRLVDALVRHKPRNPVFLGGDLHKNWVTRLHRDPYDANSPFVASEFVGTSIASHHGQTLEEAERKAASNPLCLLTNPEKRGYGVVELTPSQARVDLRVLKDARQENTGISTLASFVVEDGKPLRRL